MKDHILRRYALFACGLSILSIGIAVITKASLGTSPITSIPYSLSMVYPSLTLGNWTIVFSLILILLQLILRGKNSDLFNLGLQVIVSFLFGYVIDLGMMLLDWFDPQEYILRIVSVVAGCALLAFGVYLQVIADVVMVPGDGFVYALTLKTRKEYGKIRVLSDSTMIAIAGLIGLAFLGNLGGVREGTVISAILVGSIARFYFQRFKPLTKRLLPDSEKGDESGA